jgi:hypothetical protein
VDADTKSSASSFRSPLSAISIFHARSVIDVVVVVALAHLIPQNVQPSQTTLASGCCANTNLTNISGLTKAAGACASKLTQGAFFAPTDAAFALLGQAQL